MKSAVWHGREDEIRPYGNPRASDSANLDAVAEVQVYNLDHHFLRNRNNLYAFTMPLAAAHEEW
jgi:hypothetical protein